MLMAAAKKSFWRPIERLVIRRNVRIRSYYVVLILDGIHLSKYQLAIAAIGITAEGHK
ncbi:MAG: hypothetical protein ACI814_005272, partial [Mariniblastus sp.]